MLLQVSVLLLFFNCLYFIVSRGLEIPMIKIYKKLDDKVDIFSSDLETVEKSNGGSRTEKYSS